MMSDYDNSSGKPRRRKSPPPEQTGREAAYLRQLIDSRSPITAVLKSREQIRGRLRYYDRDYFSIKMAETGLNILIRKDSVLYLGEEA